MTPNSVAQGNHMFYYAGVGRHMCENDFSCAVLNSFEKPALYGIEDGNLSGYISIDSTDIKNNCSHGSLASAVRDGICGDIAIKIPRSITGEMNTEVTLTQGHFKFSFKITKYERDGEHGFEPVENPLSIPEDEKLGRFVELKITLVQ